MFMLSVLAAVLISSPARGAQLDQKVTLTVQAMPAEKALVALSAAGHVQLVASLQTAKEILTFRFKDVPISEAMRRIAEVVDGGWKQDKDVYQLVRSSEQSHQERSKEFAEDVAELRADIQKKVEDLKKLDPWSTSAADNLAARAQKLLQEFNPGNQSSWYQRAAALSQE